MFFSFILILLNVYLLDRRKGRANDGVFMYICASVAWGLLLFTITEIYSAFKMMRYEILWMTWLGIGILLFIIFVVQCYGQRKHLFNGEKFSNVILKKQYFLYPFAVFACIALYFSLKTVPYNWDSMTYHVSRVAHWAQNESVAHYATNIIRQITSPMFAEFVNLHVYILTGGRDVLLNLLQTVSYLTCAAMVYLIAQKLKCSPFFCFLAAIIYLTMPTAFGEALTTQVDNFATVWLLFFVYILMDFTDREEKIVITPENVKKVCILGVLVAFGYLTKPSVCVAMVIMVIWLFFICIYRKDSLKNIFRLTLFAIPAIALPILPELLRNIKTFSAFSAPIAGQKQLVGTLNPLYLFINFLKNFTYNMPTQYIPQAASFLLKVVRKSASILNVELDSETISEGGNKFTYNGVPDYCHDTANNPVVIYFMLLALIIGLLHWNRKKMADLLCSYSFIVVLSFIIFCSVLRWESFVTRYMVSYLALLCPMIVLQLQRIVNGRIRYAYVGILLFVSFTEFCGIVNYHKSILTDLAYERPIGYYAMRGSEYEPYMDICKRIQEKKYSDIGLCIGENDYEYPLWYVLKDTGVRIEHVLVKNESSVYIDEDFVPDCIIWIGQLQKEEIRIQGQEYGIKQDYIDGYYLLEKI